jgi:outer membrane protein OmpA-like peptidoglycan-associated protein
MKHTPTARLIQPVTLPVTPPVTLPPTPPLHRRHWLAWCAGLGLAATATPAAAQAVKVYGSRGAPSAEEIANILANGARQKMRQRGVRLGVGSGSGLDGAQAAAEAPEVQTTTEDATEASAFAMPIPFAFDSARLEPAARELLDVVAEGIRLNNGAFKVVVEGHTDGHGRPAYNERLSLRRAESVRRYLNEQHGLPVDWLEVKGMGPRQPLRPDEPLAAVNRRVQFRAA